MGRKVLGMNVNTGKTHNSFIAEALLKRTKLQK